MKLIIDIPETPLYRDMYTAICENGYIYDEDNENIAKIIKDGIPLEEKLEAIKAEIHDIKLELDCDYYTGDKITRVIDKHIEEVKGE